MIERNSRLIGTLVKIGISFTLLVFISSKLNIEESLRLIAGSKILYIAAAVLISFFQSAFALFRWYRIVITKEMYIPVFHIARYFWIGLFFNQILPSSIGGDAVRGYCLVREGYGWGRALLSVLLDRLLGMMGLVVLILFAAFQFANDVSFLREQWGTVFLLLMMFFGLFVVFFLDTFTAKFPNWFITKGLSTLAVNARHLVASQHGLSLMSLSVLIHAMSIAVVGVLSWSLMIEIDWTTLAIIVPVTTLIMAVPVSIAGWGVREGVMVVGLSYSGVLGEEALALSILYGLSIVVTSLPGVLCWINDPNRYHKNHAT